MPPVTSLRVRAKIPADIDFIVRLGRAAFGEYSERADLHTASMAARARTFVACDHGRRIGFAVIESPHLDVAHLSAIAVIEDERGRGVGRALLAAAERYARARGARVLELATAASNLSALDLFIDRGFKPVRRAERYYARGQDAVFLEKSL